MSFRCDSIHLLLKETMFYKLDFQTVIRFTEDIAALLKMLVLYDQEKQAGLLQTNFQQLITTIETSMNIVWPPEETSSNVNHVSQVREAQ